MSQQTKVMVPLQKAPLVSPPKSPLLQRKCACGESPGVDDQCDECRSKQLSLQRSPLNSAEPSQVPPLVYDVLHSPGQPLGSATRAIMEPHFGHDFSKVRVHTDERAVDSARSVNALAYTVGKNVVFGMGQYKPGTNEGRRLLAHELTHVVQQGLHTSMPGSIGFRDTPQEREAEGMASSVSKAQSAKARATTVAPILQREEQDFKLREPLSRPQQERHLFPPGNKPHLYPPTLGGKYITEIHVDLNNPQNVSLTWNDGDQTGGIQCSTGRGHCCPDPCDHSKNRENNSNCTPEGEFPVIRKYLFSPGRQLPFFIHFARNDVGLHQYQPVDGTPLSHGCVRLHRSDAMRIYAGSIEKETKVRVTGKAVPKCPVSANGHYFDPVTGKTLPKCPTPGTPLHPKTPSHKTPKAANEPGDQASERETALSMEQESNSEQDPSLG